MKPENVQPRRCRQTPAPFRKEGRRLWALALFILLFAGSGAALADQRRDRRDGRQETEKSYREGSKGRHGDARASRGDHDRRKHGRYDRQQNRRQPQRYDRQRQDRRDHDRRYDRQRDRHRYDGRTDRYRNDQRRYQADRYRYNRHRPRYFSVPRLIVRDLYLSYSPYRYGSEYYPAHRHAHEIYRFPVYTEYGVEYYPYAYCEGSFFGRGEFRGGRPFFDIHIGF